MNVLWFKRDLRIFDNEALYRVCNLPEPILLLYILEPSLVNDEHTSARHINFIKESLNDLNKQIAEYNSSLLIIEDEVLNVFKELYSHHKIKNVFSTQEIGIGKTYLRDIHLGKWFAQNNIQWHETQYNGVIRGIKNRLGWSYAWKKYMSSDILIPDMANARLLDKGQVESIKIKFKLLDTQVEPHSYQIGGRSEGLKWANSFFKERILNYSQGISKPHLSRTTCSRLSPYFAWGNLSIREIYQRTIVLKASSLDKRPINAFLSRLRWQSHFIQKFEMEPRMEFEAVNKAYKDLEQPVNEPFIEAWKEGKTGYPLVDASIRAVKQTGYLNFRMRTMITSFYCHHMFQHFQEAGYFLARQFLDFEPGIHYGQLQMQAGFTGTNTIRVYNPTKNAHDHDPEAIFIKSWVEELKDLPPKLAIEPWTLTELEEKMYDFKTGVSYPNRILDISVTRKKALSKLYGMRKHESFKKEKERILEKHTIKRTYSRPMNN